MSTYQGKSGVGSKERGGGRDLGDDVLGGGGLGDNCSARGRQAKETNGI